MKDYLEFALRTAILVEKQSLDFYLYAAEMVDSEKTCQMFRQLAGEEDQHLHLFHRLYQEHGYGSLSDTINQPPDFNTPVYQAFLKSVRSSTLEKEALEIALHEEKSCIGIYADLVRGFKEGDVRKVFEQALFETRMHCKMIEMEYMRATLLQPQLAEPVQKPAEQPAIGLATRVAAIADKYAETRKALPGPKVIDAEFEDT